MQLNVHPIFVHFPIAFLIVYALFEILRFPSLTRQSWYTPVKCTLLFVGTFSGYLAFLTGGMAEDLTKHSQLIEIHSTWAAVSIWIFSVLSACYLLLFASTTSWFLKFEDRFKKAGTLFPAVAGAILKIAPIGAFAGFIAVIITGALGGAIVYGPTVDPIVNFIYHIFF